MKSGKIQVALFSAMVALSACSDVEFAKITQPPPLKLSEPQSASEQFEQKMGSGRADVLVVEDTHLSLRQEQWNLGRHFRDLAPALKGLDWQMGITSTTTQSEYSTNGRLLPVYDDGRFILPSTEPMAAQKMDDMVSFDVCNDQEFDDWIRNPCLGNSQTLRALRLSFTTARFDNWGFFRDQSDLVAILITDKDETTRQSAPYTSPEEVLRWFRGAFGSKKRLIVYGIIVQSNDSLCLGGQEEREEDSAVQYGSYVDQLAQLTGGATISLCARDYKSLFAQIRDQIRPTIQTRFVLQQAPVEGSVKVQVQPSQQLTWTVKGNQIHFSSPPRQGSKISVHYLYN